MTEWFNALSVLEQIFFWLGIVATAFLIIQIILMCFSSFGGDVDIDGDGDVDVDTDSGVSIFTTKSITAFFAVGAWAGLLTCQLSPENLQWLGILISVISGVAAAAVVVLLMRAMLKLQSNGILQMEKLVGSKATVYVAIAPKRGGTGKITLNAQGKFLEIDAVTDEPEKLSYNETVEIISTENECAVVRRIAPSAEPAETAEPVKTEEKTAAEKAEPAEKEK